MTEIADKIKDIIEQNINSVEAGVVSDELKRLQEVEKAFESLAAENAGLILQYDELAAEHARLEKDAIDIETERNSLSKGLQSISNLQNQLSVQAQLLELKEVHAEQRVEDHKDMVALIFRNTEFKKTISRSVTGNEAAVITDSNGGQYQSTVPINNYTDTTITEEEK